MRIKSFKKFFIFPFTLRKSFLFCYLKMLIIQRIKIIFLYIFIFTFIYLETFTNGEDDNKNGLPAGKNYELATHTVKVRRTGTLADIMAIWDLEGYHSLIFFFHKNDWIIYLWINISVQDHRIFSKLWQYYCMDAPPGHKWNTWRKKVRSTPTHGHVSVGQLTRPYTDQLCVDTGCNLEDLPGVMDNWER